MAQISNGVWIAAITVLIAIFGAIGNAYRVIFKHSGQKKKHPCSDDIVYKDVCEANQDCLETEIKNVNNRLTDLKEDNNRRFDSIDTNMKSGFDELKTLIRNGG